MVGDYCGVGLVEVIWKAVVVILNCQFSASIKYHNYLHRFRVVHGMGTVTLEAKLLQQAAALREALLHEIFLELHKVYNYLDRSRYLYILEGYDVGPRAFRILRRYWERTKMVGQVGGYYGDPLRGGRGVTQGDPLSPTIFNVVVDVVVRHWESLVAEREEEDIRDNDRDASQTEGMKIQE